jgi:hypothetical protein
MHPSDLHVIAVFFNHYRRQNPLNNFLRFEEHMKSLGVTLHIVELVRGNLPFQVTTAHDPHHTQLRTNSEFFQKENLINIGVRNAIRMYPNSEYFAWIDADVHFFNPNVVMQTLEQLNRHDVVQMWGMSCDLGPDGHPMTYPGVDAAQVARSFGYCYTHQLELTSITKRYGYEWHTGYAWAMRREIWEKLNGLYEHSIVGSADNHMSWAFIGKIGWGVEKGVHTSFAEDVKAWCERAAKIVCGNIGYVDGLIHHHWHGRKVDRKYVSRWKVLIDNEFNPGLDLSKDATGLLHLTDHTPKLQFDLRAYMRNRNDDLNSIS